jgi:hypothetical protein
VYVGRQISNMCSTKCSAVCLGKMVVTLNCQELLASCRSPQSLAVLAATVVIARYDAEYRSRATSQRVLLKMSLHYFPISLSRGLCHSVFIVNFFMDF